VLEPVTAPDNASVIPYPAIVVGLLVKLANVCAGIVKFVNAEPSNAGKLPDNALELTVPATPSIITVLLSANTEPVTSPANAPTNDP
jgi:hypothetical protein